MCGIAGLIDFHAEVDSAAIAAAAKTLSKRGPDDCGVWTSANVGFGHQRLAIVDLSPSGHQPMVSSDGRYVIAFNGEIYNYRELRQQLEKKGQRWAGKSDTEVILRAYAEWGSACLGNFYGMFSFAIWDRFERVLFAARDRMGVKPLYYHHSSTHFAFASRPRALLALLPTLSREVDEQALRLYLDSGYVPAPYSIYSDVRKLPPAHYLLIKGSQLTLERYWDFRQIEPEPGWEDRAEEDLLDELETIVTDSVRLRMISDVPLGVFLSGGIDSAVVAGAMTRIASAPVKTFNIGFEQQAYDESGHALATARYLGTEHYSERLKIEGLLDLLPDFVEEFDEPFSDSSAFPMMALARLSRQHVTVALSGDGGDELFGGYPHYRIVHWLSSAFRLPSALRETAAVLLGKIPSHRLHLLAGALSRQDLLAAFAFARGIDKDFHSALHPQVMDRTLSLQELFVSTASSFPPGLPPASQAMRLDAFYTLPDDYLQKVDVATMAFSLEGRDPLLDHRLVEWAMRLPLKWKLHGGENKYLLRQLAYRFVPRAILDRPKKGFEVPMADWLRGPLKHWASERLNSRELFENIPIDQTKVLNLFRTHCSGRRNVHPLLWAILMLLEFGSRRSIAYPVPWRQESLELMTPGHA
jgi:asparagine synthase (glutamine-hydrolysing)